MRRPISGPGWIGTLALVVSLSACSASANSPATGEWLVSPPLASPSSATAGPCGDGQAGRYVEELFTPLRVVTAAYHADLQADVYQPADDPASCRIGVLWIHGGGFTQYARDSPAERAWGAALASRGYVVASIDYRLGTGEPFSLDQATDPARKAVVADAVADAGTALGWFRGAAEKWGLDPSRLVVGGTSAGAMIALGAGLTATGDSRPSAVVAIAGDLKADWVQAQPPPALFIHGEVDPLVPYESAVSAVDLLTRAGGSPTLVTVAGAGHEIAGEPDPELIDVVSRWMQQQPALGF